MSPYFLCDLFIDLFVILFQLPVVSRAEKQNLTFSSISVYYTF